MGTALMLPATRDRLIVGTAAALAIATPFVMLWPAPVELHDQPVEAVTPLTGTTLVLTGAAERAPLFSPTRTVADEEAAVPDGATMPASAPAPATPPPTLVGLALGRGAGVALVKSAGGDTVQVHVGEAVDGWRVIAVTRDHVVLDKGGERMSLGLNFGDNRFGNGPTSPSDSDRPQIPLPPPEGDAE